MHLLLFIAPFAILLLFTLALRRPLWLAALISYAISLPILLFITGLKPEPVVVPLTNAMFISLELAIILFGAIFFLNTLKEANAIEKIQNSLNTISDDKRVQAILLAWLFGSFIEGASGFGTPAMIVAPLLASLGFPLFIAVVLPLMANTTAVTFGAVGTPVKIGFSGLEISGASLTATSINLFAGLIVPLSLVYFVSRYTLNDLKKFWECIPFCLWAGFCFTIPYFVLSFAGPEFPSLMGGLIGLTICIVSIRKGFLLPASAKNEDIRQAGIKEMFQSFSPYLLISILLIGGKLLFQNYNYIIKLWLDVERRFPMFQPGMAFITAIAILYFAFPEYRKVNIRKAAMEAVKVIPKTWAAIFFIAALAQNLIITGGEYGVISQASRYISDSVLIFSTPFIGSFGSFAAGSATVSNLLFGPELFAVATAAGINTGLILGLQLIGSGIGNALALQNIAVVQAAVKMEGQEKNILKVVVIPCLLYMVLAGTAGLFWYYFL